MNLGQLGSALIALVVAAGLSGAIGLERQFQQKAAGFRTHMLVGVGSALFTILSIQAFPDPSETSRVAAQIVTGIGFLGAGAIFKAGVNVRGLTTAAGLWAVAAVGMAAGTGQLLAAAGGAAIILAILFGLRRVDAALYRRLGGPISTVAIVLDDSSMFASVWKTVSRFGEVHGFTFERDDDGSAATVHLRVDTAKAAGIVELLATVDGVSDTYLVDPA